MQFILKLFPEISLKSASVQRRFTMILCSNVNNILQRFDPGVKVVRSFDKLSVSNGNTSAATRERTLAALATIPGIQAILEASVTTFVDAADILAQTKATWGHQLAGKTFCVRVKRSGRHDFSSVELERLVGEGLYDSCPNGGVRMKNPDILIRMEVLHQTLTLVAASHPGLGGYPLGTQEQVLSLLSGGFDSALASYQFIKRGCRVHYCVFALGGAAHWRAVQQMAFTLWSKYGSSHNVRFIAVDFEHVLADIAQHITLANQGVVLKRMMLRVADKLAQRTDLVALVTGEALGQVASQTLRNLNVIDRASQTVVLRPLITWDKPDIIDCARKIGVAALAEAIPEYCGAISKNPTVNANLRQVEKEELRLDASLWQQALDQAVWRDVRDLTTELGASQPPANAVLQAGDVVIDVRAPDEAEAKPLILPGYAVQHIPYYKLADSLRLQDQSQRYFLYCERGVMSKMQAILLQERGFTNVFVLEQD